jgi:hypothetical protein
MATESTEPTGPNANALRQIELGLTREAILENRVDIIVFAHLYLQLQGYHRPAVSLLEDAEGFALEELIIMSQDPSVGDDSDNEQHFTERQEAANRALIVLAELKPDVGTAQTIAKVALESSFADRGVENPLVDISLAYFRNATSEHEPDSNEEERDVQLEPDHLIQTEIISDRFSSIEFTYDYLRAREENEAASFLLDKAEEIALKLMLEGASEQRVYTIDVSEGSVYSAEIKSRAICALHDLAEMRPRRAMAKTISDAIKEYEADSSRVQDVKVLKGLFVKHIAYAPREEE